MSGILVTHPGRQHSHQLATALHDRGLLYGYWTGVPVRPWPSPIVPDALRRRLVKYQPLALPSKSVRQYPVAPILRHTIGRIVSADWQARIAHIGDGLFDRLAARELRHHTGRAPHLVVCYENAARETFRAAMHVGAIKVLDAASVHYTLQDQLCPYAESEATHARIVRRKDEEIDLADHILTVSESARKSYLDAGIRPDKVVAIPLGADLELFAYRARPTYDDTKPFHFVYAGNGSLVKGIDMLLAAMANLQATGVACRLTIAGVRSQGLSVPQLAAVEWVGRLSQPALAALFGSADCLVLPSRFDSFGMVVVEALACGLPAIVSDRVGSLEVVRKGGCGWVVPSESIDALTHQMQRCVRDRASVHALRHCARATAEQYSWELYRNAVARHLRSITC